MKSKETRGRKSKWGDAELMTFGEFEQAFSVDSKRRITLQKTFGLVVVDLGIDNRGRISMQSINAMLEQCRPANATAGQPRNWDDYQFLQAKEACQKLKCSAHKLRHLIELYAVRKINLSGSIRIPLMDLKIILNRKAIIEVKG